MMRRGCVVVGMLATWAATPTGQNQPPVFRAEAETVAVNVSVKQGNVPVQGLTAADLRLYDNDVRQEVAAISQDAIPVDVSIVTPTHLIPFRDYRELDSLRKGVGEMVALLRPPSDRFRVLTPGNAVINAIPWRHAGLPADTSAIHLVSGQVSLEADAVLMALLHRTSPDRRHLVVALINGADVCSLASGDSLRRAAERSGAVFHWINVQPSHLADMRRAPQQSDPSVDRPPGTYRSVIDPGVRASCRAASHSANDLRPFLSEAVRLTGGTAGDTWFVDSVAVNAFEQIFDDFRRSYVLHYVPQGVERSGFHRLRVETSTKGYTLRARPGYWATTAAPVANETPAR